MSGSISARLFRLVVEHPVLGLGQTGLHCAPRRLVDACRHGCVPDPPNGFDPLPRLGRGSRIRTCDLEYPKLPRYLAALCPVAAARTRYTVRSMPARRADTSARLEDRMRRPVAGSDAELRACRRPLQYRAHRPPGVNQRFRQRHGALGDTQNAPVGADEDHAERCRCSSSRSSPAARDRNRTTFRAFRQIATEHEAFACSSVTAISTANTWTPVRLAISTVCAAAAACRCRPDQAAAEGRTSAGSANHRRQCMDLPRSVAMVAVAGRRSTGGIRLPHSQDRIRKRRVEGCDQWEAGRAIDRPVAASAAIIPFGPGPKRTRTNWPGRNSVNP